jgi:DNA-binding transcriptional MerR regulator
VILVTTAHQPSAYPIGEVAACSGFSAVTLRYYDEIGLVSPRSRSAAGYRIYDDDAIRRVSFIARAKQLGCTLDEIADLVKAWEGGECGPVQDRLCSPPSRPSSPTLASRPWNSLP